MSLIRRQKDTSLPASALSCFPVCVLYRICSQAHSADKSKLQVCSAVCQRPVTETPTADVFTASLTRFPCLVVRRLSLFRVAIGILIAGSMQISVGKLCRRC